MSSPYNPSFLHMGPSTAMEQQTRYLMWSMRRNIVSSGPAYHESWEERAFAEDSSGLMGGCVWPPRSYTCSFCKREFRSAQALGGHMNVHRRDRARLKQCSSPTESGSAQITTPDCYITNPNSPIGPPLTDPLPARLLNMIGRKGKRDREEDDEIVVGSKRTKINPIVKAVEVVEVGFEELDLELRLGDAPKVK